MDAIGYTEDQDVHALNKDAPPPSDRIEASGSICEQSCFTWYNLYVYCTAHSRWLDVGPVLEMIRCPAWKELLHVKTLENIS